MSNEIFHMSHPLAEWTPTGFTKNNWRIFKSICWAVQNKGENVITIDFDRFRKLTHITEKRSEKLEKLIFDTYDKIISTGWVYDDGNIHGKFNLFRAYEVNRSEQTISVSVAPEFLPLLNQLKHFTPIELAEYNSLKSTYSQVMYDLIKRWRVVGEKEWSIDEWRVKLDIPKTYDTDKINQKVLKPVMEELSVYFADFAVEKKRTGRGGKVTSLRFTWLPEDRNYTKVNPRVDVKTKAEKAADIGKKEKAGEATKEMSVLKGQIEMEKRWMEDRDISDTGMKRLGNRNGVSRLST